MEMVGRLLLLAAVLLFFGCDIVAGSGTVVVKPGPGGSFVVKVGSRATFLCEGSSTVTQWTKGSKRITGGTRIRFSDDSRTLTISMVTEADEGQYFCYASSTGGTIDYGKADLEVVVPPSVVTSNATVLAGQQVMLNCTARNFTVVSWVFEGHHVVPDANHVFQNNNQQLILKSVNFSHSGIYTCTAFNQFFTASAYLRLVVKGNSALLIQPKNATVEIGHKAEFLCVVVGALFPLISWQHNGQNLDINSVQYKVKLDGQNYTLVILNVSEGDRGQYTCSLNSDFGLMTSIPAWLTVQNTKGMPVIATSPPVSASVNTVVTKSVQIGETVTISCGSDGNDNVIQSWTKNAVPINFTANPCYKVSRGALVILKTKAEDAGIYKCVRDKLYTTNLRVRGPPPQPVIHSLNITDKLVFVKWFVPNFTRYISVSEYRVSCRLSGQQEWQNFTISSSNHSTAVDCLGNFGTYNILVTAVNSYGETSSTPKTLQYPTKPSYSSQSNGSVGVGVGTTIGVLLGVILIIVVLVMVRRHLNAESRTRTSNYIGPMNNDNNSLRSDSKTELIHNSKQNQQHKNSSSTVDGRQNANEPVYHEIAPRIPQQSHDSNSYSNLGDKTPDAYSNLGDKERGQYQNLDNKKKDVGQSKSKETDENEPVSEVVSETGHMQDSCLEMEQQEVEQSDTELGERMSGVQLGLMSEDKGFTEDQSVPTSTGAGLPRVKLLHRGDSEEARSREYICFLDPGEDIHSSIYSPKTTPDCTKL